MTVNEIALARAFRDAGIEQEKAEHIAETIFDAIRDNVATKADLATLEARIETRITRLMHDLTMRGTAGLIAAGSMLFAALHLWPPHG